MSLGGGWGVGLLWEGGQQDRPTSDRPRASEVLGPRGVRGRGTWWRWRAPRWDSESGHLSGHRWPSAAAESLRIAGLLPLCQALFYLGALRVLSRHLKFSGSPKTLIGNLSGTLGSLEHHLSFKSCDPIFHLKGLSWISFCMFLFGPCFVPLSRNTQASVARAPLSCPASAPWLLCTRFSFFFSHNPLPVPTVQRSKLPPLHILLRFTLMLFLPSSFPGFCSSLFILSCCLRRTWVIAGEISLQRGPMCALPKEEQHGTPSEPLTCDPQTWGHFCFLTLGKQTHHHLGYYLCPDFTSLNNIFKKWISNGSLFNSV